MNPNAYKLAIKKTALLIQKSKLKIDFFNIGGGFPSEYPNMKPQPLTKYFNVIKKNFQNILKITLKLFCCQSLVEHWFQILCL